MWIDLGGGICFGASGKPNQDSVSVARILTEDIGRIQRHIARAPDEETEAAFRETLYKWQCKLAMVLGANPPRSL